MGEVCEKPVCPTCGPTDAVWTQSHSQCRRCGRVLVSCCDGLPEDSPQPAEASCDTSPSTAASIRAKA